MGLHALPVSLACGSLALGSVGSVVGLMATFKRNYAKEDLLGLLLPVPRPCGQALPAHASTGGLPTLASSFSSASCGVPVPLLWVLVQAKFCLCPPRLESLFLPVLWKAYNQIP